MKLDYTKIDDVEVEGIDYGDYPDLCDAYVSSATYSDGGKCRPLTENELDTLNMDKVWLRDRVEDWIN